MNAMNDPLLLHLLSRNPPESTESEKQERQVLNYRFFYAFFFAIK